MIVFLAIVAVVLVVAISSLFLWGHQCLGASLLTFCFSIGFFYVTVYGYVDESIKICSHKVAHCSTVKLENDSGLYWTIMIGHIFATIFTSALGFSTLRKALLNKPCTYKNT